MDEEEKELYAIVVSFREGMAAAGLLPPVVQEQTMQFMHSLINCTKRIERRKIARWLLEDCQSAYGYAVQRGDYVQSDYSQSSERASPGNADDAGDSGGERSDR